MLAAAACWAQQLIPGTAASSQLSWHFWLYSASKVGSMDKLVSYPKIMQEFVTVAITRASVTLYTI